MKKIPLVNNRGFALIDDEDFERVSQHKWSLLKNKNKDYAQTGIKINNKWETVRMHRFILDTKKNRDSDHRDGNGLNNQKYNLRLCTRSQNLMNQQSIIGSSKYKGVCWDKSRKKWYSCIMINYKNIWLGRHELEIDAAEAYDRAAIKYFSEFARLNFPEKKGA